eukprot:GHVO01004092.1.p1 GENE.GHVO01004092.1~~GHVO01004092.1.p1  ORF type:complete len:103 (+),score=2.62 GHVO01004092.1:277-585(+)
MESWYSYLIIGGIALTCFSILELSCPKCSMINALSASCGAFLFSAYIIVDTRLVLGKGHLLFSEDDYVVAALVIYTDIIRLFVSLLKMIKLLGSNNPNRERD